MLDGSDEPARAVASGKRERFAMRLKGQRSNTQLLLVATVVLIIVIVVAYFLFIG